MRQHKTDFYKDGWSQVKYCVLCSAEGELLNLECLGEEKISENQLHLFEKDIDKEKKQT